MLPSFANDTITIVRPTFAEDSRHNLVPDKAAETQVFGCSVQPGVMSEDENMRDALAVRWTVFLPPGSDIRGTDRVRFNGREYQVKGEPERWQSPTGAVSHVMASLVDWEG